jgi:hypothetical protein
VESSRLPYLRFKSGHSAAEGIDGNAKHFVDSKYWNGAKVNIQKKDGNGTFYPNNITGTLTTLNSDNKTAKIYVDRYTYTVSNNYTQWEKTGGGGYENINLSNISIRDGSDTWYKLFEQYDTGGYTGSWGADGRLAMLHQKEIVLNAHDTENFLSAVKIVRSMSDMLEHNAHVAMQGLNLEQNFTRLLNNKQPID